MQRPSSDLGLDGDTSRPLRDATPGPLQRDALIADARLPDDSTLRDEGLKTDMEELDRGRFDAAPVIDARSDHAAPWSMQRQCSMQSL